jgi:peptidoglycan/xylan/chitin deacetylase (PgdA/CDA1 family)
LSYNDVRAQMTSFENEMLSLVGRYPTYMRPPYFEINSVVMQVMKDLRYRVIMSDLDTNDWQGNMDASFNAFRAGLDNRGTIVLAHDVHEATVMTLLPRMITELQRRGMKCKLDGLRRLLN